MWPGSTVQATLSKKNWDNSVSILEMIQMKKNRKSSYRILQLAQVGDFRDKTTRNPKISYSDKMIPGMMQNYQAAA